MTKGILLPDIVVVMQYGGLFRMLVTHPIYARQCCGTHMIHYGPNELVVDS